MILNKLTVLMILFPVLTFISCDPSVSYNKIIENNSDYDLKFKVYPDSLNYLSQDYKTDTFVILKHTEYTIIHTSRMSQTRQYQDCNTYSAVSYTHLDVYKRQYFLSNNSLTFNIK